MDRNYDVMNFILRRPRVVNFADMIKIVTMFIKTTLKVSKTELETVYKNCELYLLNMSVKNAFLITKVAYFL